ncbi:MAG: hypothetical protein AAF518_13410 [Spirochaetota bacterium]
MAKAKDKTEKEMLLVSSKVKAYIKSKQFMTSSEALDGLNDKVHKLIDEALARTEANKRSTLKSADL